MAAELGERELIARIRGRLEALSRPSAALVVGIGDDAAVVAPTRNAYTVMTTDAVIEGIHFEHAYSSPEDIGCRAMAANLSDLAAMGATPRWALLSLALPGGFEAGAVDGIVDGLGTLAAAHGVAVVGGNVTRSPGPLMIDVTAVGEVRPRRLLTRGGGRPGDGLFVSGTIGGAAAGLAMLRHGDERMRTVGETCVTRYRRPRPRVRLGVAIGQARAARAAMDLSDGLADGLRQMAAASGCGVEVMAETLPIDACAREWWAANGQDPVAEALAGGDDYELLFAVPPRWNGRLRQARTRVADPPLTRVGVLTRDRSQLTIVRDGRRERLPEGFEHFTARAR